MVRHRPELNIRGIIGGGVPWIIGRGTGELSADGDLEVRVRGWFWLAGPLAGTNPVATFAAIGELPCGGWHDREHQDGGSPGHDGFASAGGGNATIKAELMLPHPCIAPIVFVTSAGGSWFASTGG